MDPKELKTLLKIMRDNGVLRLKTPDVELELSHESMFPKDKIVSDEKNLAAETPGQWDNFPGGMLTPDQLMYYSSGGAPDDDPFRKDEDN